MKPIHRIASDTGNPKLSTELQDAIRNRVAFLFVRGDDGFVLKPVSERGTTAGVGRLGAGQSTAEASARGETVSPHGRSPLAAFSFCSQGLAQAGARNGVGASAGRC